MSTRVSSATNLSATYFMRNFYSNNRDAMKSSKRKEYSITELVVWWLLHITAGRNQYKSDGVNLTVFFYNVILAFKL